MYCMQQREITIRSGKEGARKIESGSKCKSPPALACSTWVSTRGAHVSARNSGDRLAVGVVKDFACMRVSQHHFFAL
jgi:hypothetical protein